MKVLFVSSGNRVGVSPIVRNQGDSLCNIGVHIDYYAIKGKGLLGYLQNIFLLRKYLKENKYDVIHAHYSLTAFVASMAGAKPLVVSLMGSDVKAAGCYKFVIRVFKFIYGWKSLLVKSKDMYNDLEVKDVAIIPNGVDMERFQPMDKQECQKSLNWSLEKKHILFPANPTRREKNFALVQEALNLLNDQSIEIHYFENVPNETTPLWYNAADVVLMTSLWEGSPNAIKEAMACNRPIISTDVGDVSERFENVAGCYIIKWDPEDVVSKIKLALDGNEKKTSRQAIIHQGLDNKFIATRLVGIYEQVNK